MSRSWELFLFDMVDCTRKIVRFTGAHSFEDFVEDELLYDATLRNLEVLGGAAK